MRLQDVVPGLAVRWVGHDQAAGEVVAVLTWPEALERFGRGEVKPCVATGCWGGVSDTARRGVVLRSGGRLFFVWPRSIRVDGGGE